MEESETDPCNTQCSVNPHLVWYLKPMLASSRHMATEGPRLSWVLTRDGAFLEGQQGATPVT